MGSGFKVHGCLAHKNLRPPRTLQWDHAVGPMMVRGRIAVSCEQGTPVPSCRWKRAEKGEWLITAFIKGIRRFVLPMLLPGI